MSPSLALKSYDKVALNSGLVLDLPMREGAGSLVGDRSRYHNNGMITGATWQKDSSGVWTTLHDGDDSVDFGALFNSLGTIWFSLWFKLTADFSTASPSSQRLLAKRKAATDITEFYLSKVNGKLTGLHYIGSAVKYSIAGTATSWVAGVWHHMLVSMSAANAVRLLVDGNLEDTDTDKTPLADGGALILGAQQSGTAGGFEGNITLFQVGTSDLTSEEEAELWNRGKRLLGV